MVVALPPPPDVQAAASSASTVAPRAALRIFRMGPPRCIAAQPGPAASVGADYSSAPATPLWRPSRSGAGRWQGGREQPGYELLPRAAPHPRGDGAPLEEGEAALDGHGEQGHQDRPAHEHAAALQAHAVHGEAP